MHYIFKNTTAPMLLFTLCLINAKVAQSMDPAESNINFHRFLNLSDRSVLKDYILQDHSEEGVSIVKRIYEAEARLVGEGPHLWGKVLPMNPEVMGYALQQVKGKTVMEIAGASGEHAILFALAGAEKVYLNDLENSEITTFEKLRANLPPNVKNKLESLKGDCLNILDLKPDLKKSVDLIFCRNLIHFFTFEQMKKFLVLLKDLLKPEGQAVVFCNSVYSFYDNNVHFKQFIKATHFQTIICVLEGSIPSVGIISQVLSQCTIYCENKNCSIGKDDFIIYEKNENQNGDFNLRELDRLGRDRLQIIWPDINNKVELLSSLIVGHVKVKVRHMNIYSKETLSELFESNEFKVKSSFVESSNGHLFYGQDFFAQDKGSVGVIITVR